MSDTKIEWTDKSWNPITGCTPVSPACDHCYAKRMARRLAGRYGYPADDPFLVTFHPDRLDEPLRWRRPQRVFVCSMGDLFHEDVDFWTIFRVWEVMRKCPQHTFQLLTKRPERMRRFIQALPLEMDWPATLPSVILMTTVWDQESADRNIPLLLATPAAQRGVSVEPMLGPVGLASYLPHQVLPEHDGATGYITVGLDWVICGAETGPGARPMQPEWAHDLYRQCQVAGVPFFFKKGTPGINYDPDMVATRELPE